MLTDNELLGLKGRVRFLNSQTTAAMAELYELKRRHPELRVGFRDDSVGSIINAYLEGDLSFQSVVLRLNVNQHNLDRLEQDRQGNHAT